MQLDYIPYNGKKNIYFISEEIIIIICNFRLFVCDKNMAH